MSTSPREQMVEPVEEPVEPVKPVKPVEPVGLVGFFGHTYVDSDEVPGERRIQYQFEIIRPFPPDRWVVQLFSFWDGSPTELAVYTEEFLLGDAVQALRQCRSLERGVREDRSPDREPDR